MRQGLFHISSSPFEDAGTECTINLSELLYKSQNILDSGTKAGNLLLSVAYPIFLPPTLGSFQHKWSTSLATSVKVARSSN